MYPYAVVSFPDENNTLSVVLSSWILKSRSLASDIIRCYWPRSKTGKASKNVKGREKNWKIRNARILYYSRTFESANQFLQKYRPQRGYELFSEYDTISRKRVSEIEDYSPAPKSRRINTVSMVDFEKPKGNLILKKNLAEAKEKKILRQDLVRQQQQHLVENIAQEEFKTLKTLHDLKEFELKLRKEEEFTKAVKQCSSLGGFDAKAAVRRILSRVFSPPLASSMSWSGEDGKTSFKSFINVLKFISVSLCTNREYKDATIAIVEYVIQRWLCYAATGL